MELPQVSLSFSEASEEVDRLMSDAVQSCMISDVPIGAALSGGLDSSAVVALMSKFSPDPVKTFSISFGDKRDELKYAAMVAEEYKTEHHELKINAAKLTEAIPFIMWHVEEPIAGCLLPTMLYARGAQDVVKVLLVGEGADELFGGYPRFKPLNLLKFLPDPILKWGYIKGLNGFTQLEKKRMYNTEMRPFLENDYGFLDAYFKRNGGDFLNGYLNYEMENELPFYQLQRVDKLTMAFSVEARVPFLDHRLVEFVCRLPSTFKLRWLNEKRVLKEAMKKHLPQAIVQRTKMGMSSPFESWFGEGGLEIFIREINRKDSILQHYFNREYIDHLLTKVGRKHYTSIPEGKLFALYLFSLWHKLFIENQDLPKDLPVF